MTEQVEDSCSIDGRLWLIDDWLGSFDCVPENQSLGFETISRSSANWSGRINHFLIINDQLFLFKVEVELADKDKSLIPFGARREIRQYYEPVRVHDSNGMHFEERLHESRYFIFDDLKIDFTGELLLSYSAFDQWNYPWSSEGVELEPTQEAEIVFVNGEVDTFNSWEV